MSLIEAVGLERNDRHAIVIAGAMGAEINDNPFAYEVKRERTLDEEFSALAGMVTDGNSNNP